MEFGLNLLPFTLASLKLLVHAVSFCKKGLALINCYCTIKGGVSGVHIYYSTLFAYSVLQLNCALRTIVLFFAALFTCFHLFDAGQIFDGQLSICVVGKAVA